MGHSPQSAQTGTCPLLKVTKAMGTHSGQSDGWDLLSKKCLRNLTTISSETSQVKRMISKVGSNEDSLEFRARIRNKLQEIKRLCEEVTEGVKDLKKMGQEARDPAERSERKIVYSKMASDLKSWLEAYAAVSREWMTQEKKKLPVKPAYGGGNQYFEEATAERVPLLESKQDLMLMENNLDLQDDIIAEREKGIAEIQGNMLEINEMFRDLNTIVIEQAPLVDSIENHIEHARFDVEKGVEEIEKASTHQKSAGG